MAMYDQGSRDLQDRYGARKLADAIYDKVGSPVITDEYRAFIEGCSFFFLATSSGENTDCSFKGGPEGFVRITAPDTLLFPDYDGNRMYKSLGNIVQNPNVGLLFIKFNAEESARYLRVRINGTAILHDTHPDMDSFPGAKRLIEVKTRHVYLNCGRYIPEMDMVSENRHIPEDGKAQPVPAWKELPDFKDALKGSS